MNMNRTIIGLAALAMNFCMVGAAEANGSGHKHARIANCAGQKMLVCTFNGDDSATNNEHDFKRLADDNKVSLSCHGNGKGGCKVKADSHHTADCGKHQGKLWAGSQRYKSYYKLLGDGDNDLVDITQEKYNSSDPCS